MPKKAKKATEKKEEEKVEEKVEETETKEEKVEVSPEAEKTEESTDESEEKSESEDEKTEKDDDGYEPGASYEDFVHKKVKEIVFGVMSPQMIKKMATVKVVTPELYDREGYPVDGGLMDVRMGVIDPGLKCPIDGKKLKECPGYFGYIEAFDPC